MTSVANHISVKPSCKFEPEADGLRKHVTKPDEAISTASWRHPPEEPALSEDEVHVWRAYLDRPSADLAHWEDILSDDERLRAKRFHLAIDRNRFIAGRGILRTILAGYLDVSPRSIAFTYGAWRKPQIGGEFNAKHIQFNLTHCDELALLAVTRSRPVGVDAEYLRKFPHMMELAKYFFTSKEYALLAAVSEKEFVRSFFRIWTCKEARLKASGAGITELRGQIDVSTNVSRTMDGSNLDHELLVDDNWFASEVQPHSTGMATVVVWGNSNRFHYWDYQ